VSDPARFLNGFVHAVSVMTLYPDGHPMRERAVDEAFEDLDGLMAAGPLPSFTFLDDEVVYGREPLRDLRGWDWGPRFAEVGIQRLELERRISRDDFAGLLDEVLGRLMGWTPDTAGRRQMRALGVRIGTVDVADAGEADAAPLPVATLNLTLGEEAETFRWLHSHVQSGGEVPLREAEAVVRSLSVAMHGDQRMVLPLLRLKTFDQYTTTHSLNVSVLAMALAEAVGCGPRDVRGIGVAGLLHDIGKVRIPLEVLTKPGRLTDEERRIMHQHPVDGARLILRSEDDLGVAAAVAYEHHIRLDGGGYPGMHYRRDCAVASRLVHVCDVFDALSTRRPYRDAWPVEQTLAYLEERAGSEFDPDLVRAFAGTLRAGTTRMHVLDEPSSQGS
jgi:putative nucleotidyltransferase with HDIG domain